MARAAARAALVAFALGCAARPDPHQLEASARADFEAGRVEEALAQMEQVVALAPDDADAHFTLGAMQLRADRVGEAEAELARAVELAPRDAKALAAHGLALRAQQKWSAAESAFVRSLLLDPGNPSTIAALAELYRLSGDPAKCAVRYEQFIWQLEQRDPKTLSESEQQALQSSRARAQECAAAAQTKKGS
jgi:Flp pilus assembly protein TadD